MVSWRRARISLSRGSVLSRKYFPSSFWLWYRSAAPDAHTVACVWVGVCHTHTHAHQRYHVCHSSPACIKLRRLHQCVVRCHQTSCILIQWSGKHLRPNIKSRGSNFYDLAGRWLRTIEGSSSGPPYAWAIYRPTAFIIICYYLLWNSYSGTNKCTPKCIHQVTNASTLTDDT